MGKIVDEKCVCVCVCIFVCMCIHTYIHNISMYVYTNAVKFVCFVIFYEVIAVGNAIVSVIAEKVISSFFIC